MQTAFITGATGFVGRALCQDLLRRQYKVVAWVRDPDSAATLLGPQVQLVAASGGDEALQAAVDAADLVIGLAGAPVAGRRWTAAWKEQMRASRVDLTARVARAIRRSGEEGRTRLFISASGVGYYGDTGKQPVTEDSGRGKGFLAQLSADWEAAAMEAESKHVRVALLRLGIVLGRGGGALAAMKPIFRLGLGGRLGSGKQYMPWIHVYDVAQAVNHIIRTPRISGPVNLSADERVTNAGFTAALGRALRRPAIIPVPALALRLVFGAAATMLLTGQQVIPTVLNKTGFKFRFSRLTDALSEVFQTQSVSIRRLEGSEATHLPSDFGYFKKRKPAYILTAETTLDMPMEEVFPFFSEPGNLSVLTPPDMSFRILEAPREVGQGALIEYIIRLGILPMRWTTRIERWEEGRLFVDSQLRGPYRTWWHEHHLRKTSDGESTVMEDRVYYTPPLGILGRVAHKFMISSELRRIFGYRGSMIQLRFGDGGVAESTAE